MPRVIRAVTPAGSENSYLNGFSRGLQHSQDIPELTKQLPALSKARAAACREVDEMSLIANPHERPA